MFCLNPYQRFSDGFFYSDLFSFQMHVSNQSEIPDHCCQFALSLNNGEFSSFCGHQHDKSCSNCEGLRKAIDSIENAVKSSKVQYESEDQKDEIQYTFSQVIFVYRPE